MGHITPAAYAQFANTFIPSFNTTFITYNLFSLVQPAAQGPDLPSSTCFDFQFHGLQYLHSTTRWHWHLNPPPPTQVDSDSLLARVVCRSAGHQLRGGHAEP